MEDSFDAKPIYYRAFLMQKIKYIHLNCIRGKWKLSEHWEDYEYSSARFYVKNKLVGFVPMHYEGLNGCLVKYRVSLPLYKAMQGEPAGQKTITKSVYTVCGN